MFEKLVDDTYDESINQWQRLWLQIMGYDCGSGRMVYDLWDVDPVLPHPPSDGHAATMTGTWGYTIHG